MIDRDAPLVLRLQFAAGLLAFIGLGAFSAWVGAGSLSQILSRSAAHEPLIAFRPLYVAGLPLAAAFLALTVLALLPKENEKRQRGRRRRFVPSQVTFGLVVGCMLSATITPPIARFVMVEVMSRRGYSACPDPRAERRPPMRWVRDGGICP